MRGKLNIFEYSRSGMKSSSHGGRHSLLVLLQVTSKVIAALDQSTLCIQGPPGAGKTMVAAHAILAELEVRTARDRDRQPQELRRRQARDPSGSGTSPASERSGGDVWSSHTRRAGGSNAGVCVLCLRGFRLHYRSGVGSGRWAHCVSAGDVEKHASANKGVGKRGAGETLAQGFVSRSGDG